MKQKHQASSDDFRLIRTFGTDHNIRRLKAHCRRLTRAPAHRKLAALMRMKRRAKAWRADQ